MLIVTCHRFSLHISLESHFTDIYVYIYHSVEAQPSVCKPVLQYAHYSVKIGLITRHHANSVISGWTDDNSLHLRLPHGFPLLRRGRHVFCNFMNSKCEIPIFVRFVGDCACLLATQQMCVATKRHRNRDRKQKDSASCNPLIYHPLHVFHQLRWKFCTCDLASVQTLLNHVST